MPLCWTSVPVRARRCASSALRPRRTGRPRRRPRRSGVRRPACRAGGRADPFRAGVGALREMARVLKRGGILYCRAEGPGAALSRLVSSRNPYRFLINLHPFAHGVVLGLSGRQLTPGTFLPSGMVFATARNITRTLEGARCEIIRIEKKAGLLGFAWNHVILARKHDGRS